MIYIVVKPNVVVDVKDLQTKMEKMTLITRDNNFHSLATSLEELQEDINAEKGKDFLKDDKLLTELFRAPETTTNKLFAINISLAKTAWITGKQMDKNTTIQDLCILYRNSVADGSWSRVSSADSKIIALTTQVKSLQDKKNKASSGKGKPSQKEQQASKATPTKKDQDPRNMWRYTKVGETTKDPTTGTTLQWCPHHGTGAYMTQGYNDQEWLEKRKRKNTKWDNNKANKRIKFSGNAEKKNPVSKPQPVKDEKHPSKLQLSTFLCQSLVTHCAMMPTEADTVLDEAFDR
jgi:hypothetical protein